MGSREGGDKDQAVKGVVRRITEIGVAMKDLGAAGRLYRDLFRARESAVYEVREFGMAMRMFRVGNIDFELMVPAGGGTIARFLERQEEGIHHIAFEVDDILEAVRRMKRHGIEVIDETPFPIEGLKAVFLHPRSTGGVLIELIEGAPAWIGGRVLPEALQDPPDGTGLAVQGIVEVAILAKDPAVAVELFTTVLSGGGSAGAGGVVTVGNVGVRISEVPPRGRPGVHHVTLKVVDLGEATRVLAANGIRFAAIRPEDAGRPREVAMGGDACAGLRVHLVEDVPPRPSPERRFLRATTVME